MTDSNASSDDYQGKSTPLLVAAAIPVSAVSLDEEEEVTTEPAGNDSDNDANGLPADQTNKQTESGTASNVISLPAGGVTVNINIYANGVPVSVGTSVSSEIPGRDRSSISNAPPEPAPSAASAEQTAKSPPQPSTSGPTQTVDPTRTELENKLQSLKTEREAAAKKLIEIQQLQQAIQIQLSQMDNPQEKGKSTPEIKTG